ncbi:P-loop NTPase fold protein [Aliarcobacter butzleri]|uniref:P-loop NTPase fold protein n=1 Tax=Aliarcobacter butzleri TaxID=28197 RepID=UPI00263D45B7|nr:P-loop NTPase fold protein [Aliarcobacter butzleri]MDN5109155.1 P-loop NTPase fold protein [Aliarcobacter butzleri]
MNLENMLEEFFIQISKIGKSHTINSNKFGLIQDDFVSFIKELEDRKLIKGRFYLSGEYGISEITFEGKKLLHELNKNKENEQINEVKTILSNNNILIDFEKLENINLYNYKESLKILKETDLDKLNEQVNKLKKHDLKELYDKFKDKNILDSNLFSALEKIQSLDLEDYQNKLLSIKNMNFEKELSNLQKIKNIDLIDEIEFEKRYKRLVSLLNFNDTESNLILYTKVENKPFKLYKNSNDSIFIKAGLETTNMSLPFDKCISIIYNNEIPRFKSYTDVLFPKILDNSIFDEIKNDNFIISDSSLIGDEIIIGDKIKIHKNNIALISSDNPSNENDDCLNTKLDIDAFAKLIAYKELKPPLAIGLFGKWGSGKSTFMDNLKIKIEELREEKHAEEIFCKKIAHIEFNAWHYSDSNLWANIMIQIFEKLNEFLVGKMPNKIENLYLELESTQKLLKEKETERTAIETKITNNKEELTNKQNQKIEKTFKLNQLKDLTKLVFEDEYIQAEINNVKKNIPSFKDKSIDEIYIKLNHDLNKNTSDIKKFLSFLRNDRQFQIYLMIGIFVILAILGILKYLDIFNKWLTSLVIIPFGMYFNRFKEVTSKISEFMKFYETVKEKDEKEEVELTLLKEQANLESELIFLEEKISLENKRLEEISFEIEHIRSGKFLADFIMERANSNDYKQHLGLISLIRNDLEKLSKYLINLDNKATHKIDRIVLYIDDLDRCSENKIMDVLEAIHLLLAFDLFIVIVGVDTRWIKKSLESKRNLEDGKTATATEYLEKIFQIPFHLNNMEEDVKKEQLKKLMKNDLIITNAKIYENINENKSKENLSNNSTNTENKNSSNNKNISENNSHKELKIEEFEYDYILKNANFLGETPRTIKRFVNIYRIIRSHEYILNELFTDFGTQYKYIVMFLCLNDKYDKNSDDNDKLTIDNYIQKLKDLKFDENDINDLEKFEKKDELFKFISRFSFRDCR